jgi:protocatechuate 3,4-dioxygenase beta subunit
MLEMLQAPAAAGATEPTVLGPFYVDDSSECEDGASIVADPETSGEALAVNGTVRDSAGRSVSSATVDVWQVQPNGRYDVEDHPLKHNLRARLRTGDDGGFHFTTVRPVDYTIPDDGPVGTMLRASGRHPWRPAHMHFAATAAGYHPLVTHLFDAASPHLDGDTVFAVRPSPVIDMAGPECTVELVLQPSGSRGH